MKGSCTVVPWDANTLHVGHVLSEQVLHSEAVQ